MGDHGCVTFCPGQQPSSTDSKPGEGTTSVAQVYLVLATLSAGVLFQKRSRIEVPKPPFLKENCNFQDKIKICLCVDSFYVFMYALPA